MNGSLIDTNVIIKVMNGDSTAIDFFETIEDIYLPVIAIGELMYGANKSSKKEYNIKLFSDFANEYPILHIDSTVAFIYGETKYELVKKGVNIPENDIWIAAIAISNGLELVTYDKHFSTISNMRLNIL